MTAVVTPTQAATPAPTEIAIDRETGQIGTVAELQAANAAATTPDPLALQKPGAKPADAVVVQPEPTSSVEDPVAAAAARLRAKGVARRARLDQEAQLRGRASTLERRLADEARARQEAEQRAAALEANPLEVLTKRGQAGKVLAQAAVDESTPEAVARRALEAAEAANRRVAEYEAAERQRQEQQALASGRERFARYATDAREAGDDGKPSDVPTYPFVGLRLKRDRDGTMARAESLIRTATNRGYRPTFDAVLQHMEDEYGAEYAEAAKLIPGASSGAEPVQPAKAEKAKGSAAAKGAATLTKPIQQRAAAGRRFEDLDVRNLRDGGVDEQIEFIAELARREQAAAQGR
jgi:hypothetical protein